MTWLAHHESIRGSEWLVIGPILGLITVGFFAFLAYIYWEEKKWWDEYDRKRRR